MTAYKFVPAVNTLAARGWIRAAGVFAVFVLTSGVLTMGEVVRASPDL
jgi:hypothetical protein